MFRSPAFRFLKAAIHKDQQNSRRDFIKTAVTSGLLLSPLAALALKSSKKQAAANLSTTQKPILILGAGFSGLTAAYELQKRAIPSSIYEARNRLGGRILTKDNFNSEGMFCELGGELLDNQFKDMLRICGELNVELDDFRPANQGLEPMVFKFAGQVYYQKDLDRDVVPFVKKLRRDAKKAFGSIESYEADYKTHHPAAIRFDRMPMAEYLYSMKGVQKWVLDFIEIAYRGEYGLDTSVQSALNLFMLIDRDASNGFAVFGESDECLRIKGGNSRFTEALQKAIAPNVPMNLEHQLLRIEDLGNQVRLTFKKKGSTTETIFADRVLCTIPFSVLRHVEGIETLRLSKVKHKSIATLGYGTNSKQMMGFKNRDWRNGVAGIRPTAGYTFSDLQSQVFWETSQMQKGNSGIITNFIGGSEGARAESERLKLALSDFDKVYSGMSAAYDQNSAFYRWPMDPYAMGSYSCPTLGQWTSIVGAAQEPELGGRLLFAGEHCSDEFQGYMNGAVQSGVLAAQLIAGLKGS